MSRAAPPGKERPGSPASKPGLTLTKLKRGYRPFRDLASLHYPRLILDRYAIGLLAHLLAFAASA